MQDIDNKQPNVAENTSIQQISRNKEIVNSLGVIEMKIDKMLKYQGQVRHLAIVRGVISFIFFLVFIVLPIVGSFYLFRYFRDSVDLNQISSQYQEFYNTLDSLKGTQDQVSDLNENLKTILPGNRAGN